MKSTAFAIALLMGGTAMAQTTTGSTPTQSDHSMHMSQSNTNSSTMSSDTSMQHSSMPSHMGSMPGPVVQPGNQNPEQDARGITVMSAPALVPPGWNSRPATGVGGPEIDPATGEALGGSTDYPPCTRQRTDNCVQAYVRGR